MNAPPRLWAWAAEALLAFGFACLVHAARRLQTHALAGPRGARRALAQSNLPLLRSLEPLLRAATAWVARWPMIETRDALTLLLRQSGNALGLTADELIACSLLVAPLGAALGMFVAPMLQLTPLAGGIAGLALAAAIPVTRVHQCRSRRQRQIERDLPSAIDLLSLCMSAGLDFTGALQLWLRRSADATSALAQEVEQISLALRMGHTRRDALRAFADAVPCVAVIDFVNTVIQAEQKGTPLATAIEIQARVLRMRRSVNAEQAAARAAVLLLLPLLLLLAAIMLLLFSPFIVNGTGL